MTWSFLNLFSKLSLDKTELSVENWAGPFPAVRLDTRDLVLYRNEDQLLVLDRLEMTLKPPEGDASPPGPDAGAALFQGKWTLENLLLLVSEDLFNKSLKTFLLEQGLELTATFAEGSRVLLKGAYGRGMRIPFSLELIPSVSGPRQIRVEMRRIQVAGFLSIPGGVLQFLYRIFRNRLKVESLTLSDGNLYYDFSSMVPPTVEGGLQEIGTRDRFLYFIAGS